MTRKSLATLFILTGLLAVLPQTVPPLQPFTLPLLAVLYLAACLFYRSPGLAVPAGVLSGLALGIGLENHPLTSTQPEGAGFFLGFSVGWVLIVLLSARYGAPQHWAWVPAGVLALFGLSLLAGETGALIVSILGRYWPLVFVFVGLHILRQREMGDA